MATPTLLVTCEHGGNAIPAPFRKLFAPHRALLDSHRGWDPGALPVARAIARKYGAPLRYSTTSRLLIDLNRSLGHPRCFSEITRDLPEEEKLAIAEEHYLAFREGFSRDVCAALLRAGRVLHLSIHSFTPVLDGKARTADIGILYDPARRSECEVAEAWRAAIRRRDPALRLRMNYPYRGTSDGHTTMLRTKFPEPQYAGLELELNHGAFFDDKPRWRRIASAAVAALADVLAEGS